MRKLFTLIEMLTVIVILGILAAIVIPNIKDQQKSAITSMMHSNIQVLQTAVDTYALKNNEELPVFIEPTLENPQLIDVERLYPKYLKSKPDYDKVKNQKYWVDVFGKVWGSTVDSPSNIYRSEQFLEWNYQAETKEYYLYQVKQNETTGKLENRRVSLDKKFSVQQIVDKLKVSIENKDTNYLISGIDQYGLESAPVGLNYFTNEDWFTPVLIQSGAFEFQLNSKDIMYFNGFRAVKDEPEGTSIRFQFATKNNNGDYTVFTDDFSSLPPSKGIKVKAILETTNNSYPSLYDIRIYYSFQKEETLKGVALVRENIDSTGRSINPEEPVRLVNEYTLPSDKMVKDIVIQDDFSLEFPPSTHYTYKDGDNWVSAPSLSDIPRGSTIRIERNYPNGEGVTVRDPIIFTTPQITVSNLEKPSFEWTTISEMAFYTHSGDGQKTHWIRSEIEDIKPENTRILYKYSNDGSSEVDIVSSLRDSQTLKVRVVMQIKTAYMGKVQNPEVKSIRIVHERGVSDLSLVQPTAMIVPDKSNNSTSPYFSPDTIVDWKYVALDPRNEKIVDAEWSGDKHIQYPLGTYEVKLRVKNESNYWSAWTTYKFEVKPEKPVAAIQMSPDADIKTNTSLTWSNSGSYDPDGDNIVNVEWQNKQSVYTVEGTYTVRLRVQDSDGNWSDWTEKTFPVVATFDVKSLSQGYDHTLFLLKNGLVKSYGGGNNNYYGQLGSTNVVGKKADVAISNVKEVYAGRFNSFALLNDGTVKSWGYNSNGQLGVGNKTNQPLPTDVSINNVQKIAISRDEGRMALFLLKDGTVMGSGLNLSGLLAQSSTSFETSIPVPLDNLSNVVDLHLTPSNAYAILQDGSVKAWGAKYGYTPVTVDEFKNAKEIKHTAGTEIVLFKDGTVKGRGTNRSYILGETTPYQTTTLNDIQGLTGIEEIELINTYPDLALLSRTSTGVVKSLGYSSQGLLGNKPITLTKVPLEAKGVSNIISLESTTSHAFAVRPDGSFYWWGYYNGQQDPRIADWFKKPTATDPTPF